MELILLKDIEKLGDKHDVVKVKPGYGRNYLIPQGLAITANAVNRKKLDAIIAEEDAKEAARVGEYQELAATIDGKVIKIAVKAGTSGKIFGSINSVQIANALKDQLGVEIERKKIVIPEDIKEVGTYTATINLHKEVSTKVEFELIQD